MESKVPPVEEEKVVVAGFTANLESPKRRFWILVIIISLLLPPLGVLIAIYLAFRAFKFKKRRLYLMAAAALVAAFISVAAVYGAQTIIYKNKHTNYSYNTLNDYKLPSKLSGAAVTFKKPEELKQNKQQSVEFGRANATLIHVNEKTTPKSGLTYLYAGSVQSLFATNEPYLKELKDVLSTPTHKDYGTMIKPMQDFIKNNTSEKVDIKIVKVTPYTSENIKDQAWQFEFTIKSSKNSPKIVPLKGSSILAVGEHTFYYLAIITQEKNWQLNQKIWQQVFDSLKIDQ